MVFNATFNNISMFKCLTQSARINQNVNTELLILSGVSRFHPSMNVNYLLKNFTFMYVITQLILICCNSTQKFIMARVVVVVIAW
jgi:hypothetical protein